MRQATYILILGGLLAGCSGPVETRVADAGPPPADRGRTFAIAATPAGAGDPALVHATTLVAEALRARGFAEAGKPAWLIEVALSARPASIGVRAGDADKAWIAPPKRHRLLQRCADGNYTLALSFLDTATGAVSRTASAAEYHCHAALDDALPHLVTAALTQGPSGVRLRPGRD